MVTAARKIAPGIFAIDSFNGAGSYTVNLEFNSCSCPHFTKRLAGTNRGDCKHLTAVKEQQPMIEALEKAAGCTDEQIDQLLPKYANSPVVGGALRCVRQERRDDLLQADYEAHMRSVFA